MDAKSLAKSKRAHSQHHSKKNHPKHISKGPSASSIGASSTNKELSKEIREKPRQSKVSDSLSLPSNWDRYEEEYDSGTEDPFHDRMTQRSDIVVPKSKGADYAHLISEAKSQYQTSSCSEIFPSFDDVVTDFDQGRGSFLSVRGQSILSWIEGDSFLVEDKATANHEAPFLSLDLHALAEQLSKVDLSKRLFIEADLLPPELCASDNSGPDQATSRIETAKILSDELPAFGLSDGDKHAYQIHEVTSSDTPTSNHPVQDITNERPMVINEVKYEFSQFGRTDKSTVPQPMVELDVISIVNPDEKQPRFEAEAAEAELDMLLGSFSETKFFDSPGFIEKSSKSSYMSQGETSTSSLGGASNQSTLPVKKGPDISRSPIAADLDDTLDELLKETSDLINQNGTSLSHEVKAAALDFLSSPSSHPTSKSKLMDDFDSWLDTI